MSFRRLLMMVVIYFVAVGAAGAASVQFQQVDWLAEGGGYVTDGQNSDWCRVEVTLDPSDFGSFSLVTDVGYVGYLNVVTTVPGVGETNWWGVQNHIIVLDELTQAELDGRLPESTMFGIDVSPGLNVTELYHTTEISSTLMTSAPGPAATGYPNVGDCNFLIGGLDDEDGEGYFGGTGKKKITKKKKENQKTAKKKAKKKKVPIRNVKEDPNGCGPGSATRSLFYLADTDGRLTLADSVQDVYDDLFDEMETTLAKGTKKAKMKSGLESYITKKSLPVVTKQQSDFTDILKKLGDGHDVEILVYWGEEGGEKLGGHVAHVVEIIELMDDLGEFAGYQVTIVDDGDQDDATASSVQHVLYFDEFDNLEYFGDNAKLIGFQIDEVIPEPSTFILLVMGSLGLLARARGRRKTR